MTTITGSIVALATPMNLDGSVDYPALRKLIDWHITEGTDCIGVVGTTGESPTVSVQEHCEIIRVSVEESKRYAAANPNVRGGKHVPIMAGCGANSTAEAIELAKYAKQVGADCQLQVVPYYNRPTQEGQYLHFKAIAEAVALPMVLYNVPGRTVADMSVETTLRLAHVDGIVGIKEASGNIDKAQWLIKGAQALKAELKKGFAIYSGDDPTAVAMMLCGGQGNISVTANIAPKLLHELCVAAVAGDIKTALAIQFKLLSLHKAMGVEGNPIAVKWAMKRLGLCGPAIRLPLTELTATGQAAVEVAMREAGLLA
jgi:4-hydroxy-tetrahydrodipicolinate synthase